MENTKLNIISALERVFLQAKDSKLERNHFKLVDDEIAFINSYFQTYDLESILITLVINIENLESIRLKNLAEYVGLNNLNFLLYMKKVFHYFLLYLYLFVKHLLYDEVLNNQIYLNNFYLNPLVLIFRFHL